MVDTPAIEEPGAPDISHQNPADRRTWFGHPRELARLFTTEAMERFGYYGMRALLTLYLAQHFLFSDQTTTGLYGGFTALVYLTPLIGGLMADRFLGSKRSVKFGAILMSLGYLTLCFGGQPAKPYAMIDGQRYEVVQQGSGDAMKQFVVDNGAQLQIKGNEDKSVSLLGADGAEARKIAPGGFEAQGERNPFYTFLLLIGLALVVIGNGFFKPNISTMVGSLYAEGDRRRDAGFTIFYMGINLGSLFSQILCPLLAVGMGSWGGLGWWAGFGLAAAGMLVSWTLIQFDGGKLDGVGDRPQGAPTNRDYVIYIGAILAIPVAWFLFSNLMHSVEPEAGTGIIGYVANLPIMGKIMFGTFLISVPGILIWSWLKGSKTEFQMMIAAMVLITFNVVFWTLFEQAGSSLTLFADRNTDLSVFGLFSISAGQTQFFNAAFIVLLAPLFSILWNSLARRGLEPPIPIKFGACARGRRGGLPVPGLGIAIRGIRLQGRFVVAGRALFDPFGCRTVHFAGRPQHDHQALDRADRGHDDGCVVPLDRGGAICRRPGRPGRIGRNSRRSGDQPPGQPQHLSPRVHHHR